MGARLHLPRNQSLSILYEVFKETAFITGLPLYVGCLGDEHVIDSSSSIRVMLISFEFIFFGGGMVELFTVRI
ncbi:MAG: hypothetical protein COB98_07675 [Flavobacteriaceae bacterium]|nr:MAG: hypothetical protein COB98_07675 [Flavobacteriaceae bacterium]